MIQKVTVGISKLAPIPQARKYPEHHVRETERHYENARSGNADAQNKLGKAYLDGHGIRQNDATAIFWLKRAAAQKHTGANFNLGVVFEFKGNKKEAFFWYQAAARLGHIQAQRELSLMITRGEGLDQESFNAYKQERLKPPGQKLSASTPS